MAPIMALAGRRVDAPDQHAPRFPLDHVGIVRDRLHGLLRRLQPAALVCSAACGADLLALDAAGAQGLRRRVVLPFDPATFRRTSVVDRPGDWGPVYDGVMEQVETADDLVNLGYAAGDHSAYAAANERILDEALSLAQTANSGPTKPGGPVAPEMAIAVIVWEGRSRGSDDLTERFAVAARRRGMTVEEILTV